MENFILLSAKYAESMDELTSEEISLLHNYIRDILELEINKDYDVFNPENSDWITDTISVFRWHWQDQVIIDLFGFPGDNEDGCLYLNGNIVAYNSDRDLAASLSCPPELANSLQDLAHLRPNGDLDCEEQHEHCIIQHKKYVLDVERKCTCPVC